LVISLGINTVSFDPDPAARDEFRAAHNIADGAVAALFPGRRASRAALRGVELNHHEALIRMRGWRQPEPNTNQGDKRERSDNM
jgi:hypothetical protein